MLGAMEELLPIGEFAACCGLSPKMLRTYAADGLLTPAAVDRDTGYRFYSPAQVGPARVIAALRRAAVPLAEIAAFLRDGTPGDLDRWEHELDAELDARRDALHEARRLLAPRAAGPRPNDPPRKRVPTMELAAAAETDRGRVRPTNQDAVLAAGTLFAVADGMGGAPGGEMASEVALQTLAERWASDTADTLGAACRAAGLAVWERARDDADLEGAGTTLTAVAVERGGDDDVTLVIANVGDSRAYLLDGAGLRQLTDDHSLVADLVRAGQVPAAEARTHPQRNILTRALGVAPDIEADVVEVRAPAGSRLLLCTDGLHLELDDDRIAEVLGAGDPAAAAAALVRAADAAGGRDNTSVVVVDLAPTGGGPA